MHISVYPDFSVAVALDGTVIHKSGLITGGRSTRDSTKKWDETDVKGMST
jgi:structural maintenance of chromosome 1